MAFRPSSPTEICDTLCDLRKIKDSMVRIYNLLNNPELNNAIGKVINYDNSHIHVQLILQKNC